MNYYKSLINRITNPDKWPHFKRPNFLHDLNMLAEESVSKNTIEGYLAALLIFHQLTEEILKILLKKAEFFMQVQIFPAEIHFPERDKMMFGKLIDELRNTVSFENKSNIVKLAEELNSIRIEIVHKLTKQPSIKSIKPKVLKAYDIFEKIFDLFGESHEYFQLTFKDLKKDIDWEDYLNNY